MATLTVRNLNEDLVRRLRIRAAEHGRSAEAEHRDILQTVLVGHEQSPTRQQAAERLAEFRRRTTGRGSPTAAELLEQSRAERMETLTGTRERA
jgi:plasmid stability protein